MQVRMQHCVVQRLPCVSAQASPVLQLQSHLVPAQSNFRKAIKYFILNYLQYVQVKKGHSSFFNIQTL